jgi:hypothetical protein
MPSKKKAKTRDGIFINMSRRPKLREMLAWLMEKHRLTPFADVAIRQSGAGTRRAKLSRWYRFGNAKIGIASSDF